MVNFFAVCGCCTRTDIVREHLEDTLRICDVSAKGLYEPNANNIYYSYSYTITCELWLHLEYHTVRSEILIMLLLLLHRS
jgi:hypothetical protein